MSFLNDSRAAHADRPPDLSGRSEESARRAPVSKEENISVVFGDRLRSIVLIGGIGLTAALHLFRPAGDIPSGLILLPLVIAVLVRSLQTCVVANLVVVGMWVLLWQQSGADLAASSALSHAMVMPLLSIAMYVARRETTDLSQKFGPQKPNEYESAADEEDCCAHLNSQPAPICGVESAFQAISVPRRSGMGDFFGTQHDNVGNARCWVEEQFQQQKAVLEQIIETVPDQIFVKDKQRRLMLANRAYFESLNQKPADLLGEKPEKFIPEEVVEISRESDRAVLERGETVCRDVSFTDKAGKTWFHEIRKLPLMEDGKVVGVVGLCRDLTERRLAEQRVREQEILLLHASRLSSIGELVAGIAHEINQPLFTILNYAKAIENTLDSIDSPDLNAIREWVGHIHREASRGGKITQRLKSFVKQDATHRESMDINEVIRESIGFVEGEARQAGVTIQTCFDEPCPAVSADRIQIQQVLVNLMKNSFEALDERPIDQLHPPPRVVVSSRALESAVEVSVADNGPGLTAPSDMNILEPFQTTKRSGVGLGLAISRSIVESHHGVLTYHSNDLGGATFRFIVGRKNRHEGET